MIMKTNAKKLEKNKSSIGKETKVSGTDLKAKTPTMTKKNNEGNSELSETRGNRSTSDPCSENSSQIEESTTENTDAGTSDESTEGRRSPEQLDVMRLNVVHLLFLHGLLCKFYEAVNHEPKMQNFLHDLILMFEIYIDTGNPSEELVNQFNYQPLKTENDEA